ncbi:MAG: DAK2 domain-containing protein [Lachnospiraceae bacterium]|nr:DAK2 domain-containing protein [Lachnospiraceae bacterium]MCI9398938.1 DAK2 domain-containing protein [Lachnospiraceae bacterium]MCX4376602.1 DAK2 domain-containing protein [Lachnospiraceae bacterium]
MGLNVIDAKMFSKMFLAGAKNLEHKKEWINELNVFPVPDGDTGTNMCMTIMSAAKEVAAVENLDMMTLAKAVSSGSLRGARGNSGVILSQLFRGFTKVIREYDELNVAILASACDKAVETAYKAVMKPKEGTILTVAKGAAKRANDLAIAGEKDLETFLKEVIKEAEVVLSQTPDMLPVLKQAGVVDSGGQGLVEVLKGCLDAYLGKELDLTIEVMPKPAAKKGALSPNIEAQANAEIKFCYCTQFLIMLNKTFNIKHEMDFKEYLSSIGDSIVVVADEEIVKVHVHTNDPGLAMQKALRYGSLTTIIIENMRLERDEKVSDMMEKQMQSTQLPSKEPSEGIVDAAAVAGNAETETPQTIAEHKETGFIAVSIGEGMNEIFRSLGVDYIIEGGQTMNPSTEDMLNAIETVDADNIFIFPNNKNIILAANQAKQLTKDKNIYVIPTKTVPQGITAIINYVPDVSVEENEAVMTQEAANVATGQVTYAVRDTVIDDKEIHQGDFMGIGDKGILSVGTDLQEVAFSMISEMMKANAYELISVYYGDIIQESQAQALADRIKETFEGCDVELQFGGQPIYAYIVSAE